MAIARCLAGSVAPDTIHYREAGSSLMIRASRGDLIWQDVGSSALADRAFACTCYASRGAEGWHRRTGISEPKTQSPAATFRSLTVAARHLHLPCDCLSIAELLMSLMTAAPKIHVWGSPTGNPSKSLCRRTIGLRWLHFASTDSGVRWLRS